MISVPFLLENLWLVPVAIGSLFSVAFCLALLRQNNPMEGVVCILGISISGIITLLALIWSAFQGSEFAQVILQGMLILFLVGFVMVILLLALRRTHPAAPVNHR